MIERVEKLLSVNGFADAVVKFLKYKNLQGR